MRHRESKIRVSIVGITGYTGLELLRLCLAHPDVAIAHLTARRQEDVPIGTLSPHLAHLDLKVTDTDHTAVAEDSDVVFLALPHKAAQDVVAALYGRTKIIDLSADYRLDDLETYEKYYGPHAHPELLGEIVYGLPELNRAAIAGAQAVANPGCFALLSQILLYPYAGRIGKADILAVTGSSGLGKTPVAVGHHPVRNHSMKSYAVNAHRHIPEILRTARMDAAQLNFVPTSGPFTRGIFATAFVSAPPGETLAPADPYGDCSFVRRVDTVDLAHIVGSNFCDLNCKAVSDSVHIVQGAIDNLVKGAAGCAIQNMNLMCGLDETAGLWNLTPVYP